MEAELKSIYWVSAANASVSLFLIDIEWALFSSFAIWPPQPQVWQQSCTR
jgi:hypothetical protein